MQIAATVTPSLRLIVHAGNMYATGDGVAEDMSVAVGWYHDAAQAGDPSAQYNLGVVHANGVCVEQDLSKAIMWSV